MTKCYIVTAEERAMSVLGNGDMRDDSVNPYRDSELVFDGDSIEGARAAAEEFAKANPCEFVDHGIEAVACYWKIECCGIEEIDGEDVETDEFTVSTLDAATKTRLRNFADLIDEAFEEN